MAISPLPTPPTTNDPANFAVKADALLAALPQFVTETNATASAMSLNSTNDTSASSVLIGTGAKSFTASPGKSFQPGMWLVFADTAAPSTNAMVGSVTSYDAVTGAMVVNIVGVIGSGTKTAWTISQSAFGAAAGANSTITSLTGLTQGGLPASSVTPANLSQKLTVATAVATTSGSAIDFTSIPSWVRRINVSLVGVSVTGVDSPAIQLGTGGVPTTTGYKTQNQLVGGTANPSTASLLVGVVGGGAGNTLHGNIQIVKLTGNSYSMSSVVAVLDGNAGVIVAAGSVTLAGALDMIRLLITGGQTFDAGSVNIIYE